ncbi:MAG: hypothetical protein HY744_11330 [Deltaproteobacteria bacterium]|nr:hypothetical protein [Deltaproteobacteria bacterium]
MPATYLLQDWKYVSGTAGDEIVQEESGWLDLGGLTDVTFYLTVKSYSGAPTIHYQTSPSKDNDLFASMDSVTPGAAGRTVTIVRYSSASEPLARWVRWRITAAAAFTMNFRLWVAAVATG